MRRPLSLPRLLTLALALGGSLLLLAAPPPPSGLRDGRFLLRTAQAQAQLTLTREGLLRITATSDGSVSVLPPVTLEFPMGAAFQEVVGTADAVGAGYRLSPSGPASVTVSQQGRRPFHLTLESGASRLTLRIVAHGATAFHGFGQAVKALGVKDEGLELYHEPRFGDQTYLHMPFFFSDSGLAVAFNAAGRDQVDVSKG